MQLSFAVFPLVAFTSDKVKMGAFVNGALLRTKLCRRGCHRRAEFVVIDRDLSGEELAATTDEPPPRSSRFNDQDWYAYQSRTLIEPFETKQRPQ